MRQRAISAAVLVPVLLIVLALGGASMVLLTPWVAVAVVAFLAWTRQQPAAPASQGVSTAVVVKGANGKRSLVVVPATAATTHATTRTSPVPAG